MLRRNGKTKARPHFVHEFQLDLLQRPAEIDQKPPVDDRQLLSGPWESPNKTMANAALSRRGEMPPPWQL
jgi:hypothetical protein